MESASRKKAAKVDNDVVQLFVPCNWDVDRIMKGGRDVTAIVMDVLATRDIRHRAQLRRYKAAIAHCINADRVKPTKEKNTKPPVMEQTLETMGLCDSTEIDKRLTQAATMFIISWPTLNTLLIEIDQKIAAKRNGPPPVLDDYSGAQIEAQIKEEPASEDEEEWDKENVGEEGGGGMRRAKSEGAGDEKPVLSLPSPLLSKKQQNRLLKTARGDLSVLKECEGEEEEGEAKMPDLIDLVDDDDEEEGGGGDPEASFLGREFDDEKALEGDAVDETKSREDRFRSFVHQILYHVEGEERQYLEWIVQLMLDPSYYAKLPSVYHRAKVLQYFKLILPSLHASDFGPEAVLFSKFVTDKREITIHRKQHITSLGWNNETVAAAWEAEEAEERERAHPLEEYIKRTLEEEYGSQKKKEEEEYGMEKKEEEEERSQDGQEFTLAKKEEGGWDWLEEDEMRRREAGELEEEEDGEGDESEFGGYVDPYEDEFRMIEESMEEMVEEVKKKKEEQEEMKREEVVEVKKKEEEMEKEEKEEGEEEEKGEQEEEAQLAEEMEVDEMELQDGSEMTVEHEEVVEDLDTSMEYASAGSGDPSEDGGDSYFDENLEKEEEEEEVDEIAGKKDFKKKTTPPLSKAPRLEKKEEEEDTEIADKEDNKKKTPLPLRRAPRLEKKRQVQEEEEDDEIEDEEEEDEAEGKDNSPLPDVREMEEEDEEEEELPEDVEAEKPDSPDSPALSEDRGRRRIASSLSPQAGSPFGRKQTAAAAAATANKRRSPRIMCKENLAKRSKLDTKETDED